MTRREYQRLVRRAALAYNLNSEDFTPLMDKAAIEVDDWDQFVADFDEAKKTPPTQRQLDRQRRREKQREIEDAKRDLRRAQRRLAEAMK